MTVDLSTVAGVAAITTIIVQIILTATGLSDQQSSRWGPLLAIGVAVVLAVLHAASLGSLDQTVLLNSVLLGISAGAAAMGIHNVTTKSAVGEVVTAALGIPNPPAVLAAPPSQAAGPPTPTFTFTPDSVPPMNAGA